MSRPSGVPYDLVVFDLDGVLVDSESCHAWAFEQLWAECGVEPPDYGELAGRRTLDVVRERTAHLAPSEAEILRWVTLKQTHALECFEQTDVAYPDALPTLEALRSLGVPMAVATGATRARADAMLGRLGAAGWLRAVVTADDVERGKPDPETYTLAMARSGAAPERTAIVEDSVQGVASGLAAGARVASVRSGVQVDHPNFLGACGDLREFVSALGVPAP